MCEEGLLSLAYSKDSGLLNFVSAFQSFDTHFCIVVSSIDDAWGVVSQPWSHGPNGVSA